MRSESETDDASNVQGLCAACHDAKTKEEAARGVRRIWQGYR